MSESIKYFEHGPDTLGRNAAGAWRTPTNRLETARKTRYGSAKTICVSKANSMTARIYRPAPNAMQSGRGKSKDWVLVHEPAAAREIDPLMGYTSTTDTQAQIKLSFETLDEAKAYAERNGIPYQVMPDHKPTVKRNSYSDNFRSDRKTPWTH